jgi:hypothetical protein
MKKYNLSAENAVNMVQNLRESIDLCQELCFQLYLWQQMSYKINANNPQYRKVLFIAFKARIKRELNRRNFDLILNPYFRCFNEYFYKSSLSKGNEESLNELKIYYCNHCNNQLFTEINVFKNSVNLYGAICCQSIYIEPMEWMIKNFRMDFQSLDDLKSGLIRCYKCYKELGKYDWIQKEKFFECSLHKVIKCFQIYEIDLTKVKNNNEFIA